MLILTFVLFELLALPLVAEPPLVLPEDVALPLVDVWFDELWKFTWVLLLQLDPGGVVAATDRWFGDRATVLVVVTASAQPAPQPVAASTTPTLTLAAVAASLGRK